jgi:hypothetical protein
MHIYGGGFGARPEPGTGSGVIEGEYSVVDSDAADTDQPRLKDGSSDT